MNPDPKAKFKRWVKAPIESLRRLPDGDGAFAALSICCGLFERFIDSRLHKSDIKATPEAFREDAAGVLGCKPDAVQRFWDGYRLGMQHAFQPKAYVQDKGEGDRWGWEIAEADGFHHYPEIIQKDQKSYIVRIDPWKFTYFVLHLWEKNPELLNQLSEFVLGDIAPAAPANKPEASPAPIPQYCKTYYEGPPATGIYPGNTNA